MKPFRLTTPSPSTRRRSIPRALARQHHRLHARQARARRVDGRNRLDRRRRRVTGRGGPATPTGAPLGARRSRDGAEIRGVLPARPEGAAQAAAADDRDHGVVGDAREAGAGGERRSSRDDDEGELIFRVSVRAILELTRFFIYRLSQRRASCSSAALIHSLVVKNLTSRLHSSTFWEQLHTTVRQENILKKLAGPPIRPRPRPAKGQGKAWKLVRGSLQKKKERQKKKDGSDNLVHDQGGRRHGRTKRPPRPRSVVAVLGRREGWFRVRRERGSLPRGTNRPERKSPTRSRERRARGTLGAGDVPIAVVNAAARHVKKGMFSLPFRKTTMAMHDQLRDRNGWTPRESRDRRGTNLERRRRRCVHFNLRMMSDHILTWVFCV